MRNSWKYSNTTTSKFHNKKVEYDGIIFDSVKECNRYKELAFMADKNVIQGLAVHYPFVLIDKSKYGRAIKYVADFVYTYNDKLIVEDVKSSATKTPLYRLKKRLLAERCDIEIEEI